MQGLNKEGIGIGHARRMTQTNIAAAQGGTGGNMLQEKVTSIFDELDYENASKTDRRLDGRRYRNQRVPVPHNFAPTPIKDLEPKRK